ncbi:type I polyketide synthase [Actibacterium lipolyticum]|uniref:Polyketide synthase PksN n=1 Tax=Actibacterium lipolyticum TaxID=1524263 RepID=A0A238JY03_9RHOB|nr:type I polyketide synthase [Actibacterium lipolyticum]SMX34722.1 Polyketide synthase PksN [Actibacterium lipolyticum]
MSRQYEEEPIAIVGMDCIFPKAPNREAFWKNILDKVDAVDDAPADWHGDLFLDPESEENDRVYTTKGGFLGDLATFDPLRHGVMPSAIDGGEPDQFLALEVAARAVEDAEFALRPVPGDRVAVILGRGTYINRGFTSVVQHGIMIDRFLDVLKKLHPDTEADELAAVKKELKSSLPPFNAEIAPALVPNLVTGRISNRLDFRGANYIVDAACASSLIALERGVVDLRAGRCDMAVVGGVHASTPAPIYQIFCQLEALSKKGAIKPFSAEADGTLLGEGVGILCIKRLSDAEAAGDKIYALVRGVGVASDGKGLGILAPRIEGEALALERAYVDAGIDPKTVGLVEAHGTATSVGDATEVEALAGQFGGRSSTAPDCALGAVKSMIGHCLPASGSAGLIKTAMALHHRTLPPTLVDTQNPDLRIEDTPFYLNTESRPWIHGGAEPRRAGVNAFGFGGINAHAVLEEYRGAPEPQPLLTRSSEALLLDAHDSDALLAKIAHTADVLKAEDVTLAALSTEVNAQLGTGTWRLGVVASDKSDALAKLDKLAARIRAGKTKLKDRKGAYLSSAPLGQQGKLAFMFPGEGSQHIGMLRELMMHHPEMRQWFDVVDGAFRDHSRSLLPSQVIFPPPGVAAEGDALWRMDIGPEAIFAANQAVAALYGKLGLSPDMLVGHSTGEYSALYAAGVTRRDDPAELQAEMRALNDAYEVMERDGAIAAGALIAVGAVPADTLNARLAERDDVFLAMDNCPNQKVIAAFTDEARVWAEKLAGELGGFGEALPFERAYHSPAFAQFSERLESFLGGMEINAPEIPVYSCQSTARFGEDADSIRKLTADQWSDRVRFTETIQKMHDDGARVFVECGPRNNLTAFTNDILRGKDHVALAVDTPARAGLDQLHHFVAQLAVEGVPLNPAAFAPPASTEKKVTGPTRPQVLKMGIQPMELKNVPPMKPRAKQVRPSPPEAAPTKPDTTPVPEPTAPPIASAEDQLIASYFDTMEQFVSSERDIMSAYFGAYTGGAQAEVPTAADVAAPARFPMLTALEQAADGRSLTARIEVDVARAPYVLDHSFGRGISQTDPALTGLPVVPLTFTMEALAEAAAALRPDMVVSGMTEVRASRWLALDRPVLALEASVELRSDGDPTVVHVRLREAEGPALRPILVEADVELRTALPEAPVAPQLGYGAKRDVRWSLDDVYSRIMFHGPKLQAVESMDLAASDGCEGVLCGMPHDGLYAGTANPAFETDAITLDAVGQLVGVWSAEMLPEAFHIFPFRVEKLEIFRPRLAPGERARCRSKITLIGEDEMSSYIDVVSEDGHLQCRIEGWWDKRFNLPESFYQARLNPAQNCLARPLPAPNDGVAVALIDDLSSGLFDGSGGIWAKVLAGLILTRSERADWDALATATDKRRWEWLRGRSAAKDAVRMLLQSGILPADIEVTSTGPDDGPIIGSTWATEWGARPHISISHTGEYALSAAVDPAKFAGVGVDIERVKHREEAFLTTAFSPAEREMIATAPEGDARDRLVTRLWCAKEATGKSFGVGLAHALDRFEVVTGGTDTDQFQVKDKGTNTLIHVKMMADIAPGVICAIAVRPL